MRKTSLDMVYQIAKKNKKVIFVGSDLGFNILNEMKANLPKNFFMEGVCEQNLIGMSAGLAMEGYIPYVNTIGTFLTRRCYEQIFLDICLHNLSVRLIGNGGGAVYAPLGPTHLSIEDIAILRVIPNLTIVSPCDAVEMKKIMLETENYPGPVYIRLGKGGDKVVTKENTPTKIGKAVELVKPQEAVFITTGTTTQIALEATKSLNNNNFKVGVVHLHTIKPLDTSYLKNLLNSTKFVVSVEEHSVIGGLGSSILEFINDSDIRNVKMKRIGIPDKFAEQYGTQETLLKSWKIDKNNLIESMKKLLENN
jgi:transketolase